ncbi:MAG: hypothetical protein AAF196_05315 [Planctomycetota bacterium]
MTWSWLLVGLGALTFEDLPHIPGKNAMTLYRPAIAYLATSGFAMVLATLRWKPAEFVLLALLMSTTLAAPFATVIAGLLLSNSLAMGIPACAQVLGLWIGVFGLAQALGRLGLLSLQRSAHVRLTATHDDTRTQTTCSETTFDGVGLF